MSLALEARDITKVYGHVSALSGANFEVKAGEVTALIGDNGAGKSTLVKILSGTETPTSGEILIDGKPVTISGPSRRAGTGSRPCTRIWPWRLISIRCRTCTSAARSCARGSWGGWGS